MRSSPSLTLIGPAARPWSACLNNYDDGVSPEEVADIFEVALADVQVVLAYRDTIQRVAQ